MHHLPRARGRPRAAAVWPWGVLLHPCKGPLRPPRSVAPLPNVSVGGCGTNMHKHSSWRGITCGKSSSHRLCCAGQRQLKLPYCMVSCSGFGLPLHAQLLRLFVTSKLPYCAARLSCIVGHISVDLGSHAIDQQGGT